MAHSMQREGGSSSHQPASQPADYWPAAFFGTPSIFWSGVTAHFSLHSGKQSVLDFCFSPLSLVQ